MGRRKDSRSLASMESGAFVAIRKKVSSEPVIEIRNLWLSFRTEEGTVRALNGINLAIPKGKTFGLVGESGSGKTVCALSMMGLIPIPPGQFGADSEIIFQGKNILQSTEHELETIRGTGIAMVFQEPMSSLNPVYKIGDQLAESIRTRILRTEMQQERSLSLRESIRGVRGIDEVRVRNEVIETLQNVRISDPSETVNRYPHELSGGMRQRVMIAMAIASRPALLIADEPTTSLDVSIQAQIISLLRDLVREVGVSVLFISHDLSVVAEIAEEIAVMYAGRIVEQSDIRSLFSDPKHPYTEGLINAQPKLGDKRRRLESLKGTVPSLIQIPPGCAFHPRCPYRFERCDYEIPPLLPVTKPSDEQRLVACHLYTENPPRPIGESRLQA
jgi:oligopeptide/dipeptide ABC transporter ATP-binding protein